MKFYGIASKQSVTFNQNGDRVYFYFPNSFFIKTNFHEILIYFHGSSFIYDKTPIYITI